jgi:hypothetical protein
MHTTLRQANRRWCSTDPGESARRNGVQVDEAGCDDQPVGVDDPVREARRAAPDLRDPAILDPQVGPIAWYAGTVDDCSTPDLSTEAARSWFLPLPGEDYGA